jgi:hypothetical protein
VTDSSRALTAAIVGGVIGGMAGYLFFTEHGRRLRRELEPALDDAARELNSFRATMYKAANVATDGWRLLSEALGEAVPRGSRFSGSRQTSPF